MEKSASQKVNKYIWFTFDGCGIHIAKKLQDEGNTVILAQIQTKKELGIPNDSPEKPEDEKIRLTLGNGLMEKRNAIEVLKKMKSMPNKEEWFVVFDFNNLWRYSEATLKMGFTNGFFCTKEQWEMEEDRNKGKEFVKANYKDLEVAEVHEFTTIEEGIAFLEDTDKIWVLKSYNPAGSTIVPSSDDVDKARQEIEAALEVEKKDYEKDGFILEEMIPDPIEITPEIQFYNGKVIMTTVDIENKPIGASSTGNMTGCSSNLIIKTELTEEINKIAFPKAVHEMAQNHPGLFVWDSSILINPKTKKLYFGEFCANRWGWDSFFTNLSMCESVSDFFQACVDGRNPLVKDYGVAVRMFNLKSHIDVPVILGDDGDKDVWFYDVQCKEDKYMTCGLGWDTYVVTGAGDTLLDATEEAYENLKETTMTNGYYRPKFDFLSKEYNNSVINRYEFTMGWLYKGDGKRTPDMVTKEESDNEIQSLTEKMNSEAEEQKTSLDRLKEVYKNEILRVREQIKSILNESN